MAPSCDSASGERRNRAAIRPACGLLFDALIDSAKRFITVDQLPALGLEPAAFDLFAPLHADLVVLLEESEALANYFAGVVVEATIDLVVYKLLEFWGQ